jgi:hypothetical protein
MLVSHMALKRERMNKETAKFKNEYRKLYKLVDGVGEKKFSEREKKALALCMTELLFCSKNIKELLCSISAKGESTSKRSRFKDKVETDLVNLKIQIYDEFVDWARVLKAPLNSALRKMAA